MCPIADSHYLASGFRFRPRHRHDLTNRGPSEACYCPRLARASFGQGMSTAKSSHSWAHGLTALTIIAIGLALRWPVLYTGFTVDDYAQLAMIHGDYPVPRAPLSLFTFSNGS